MSTEFGHKRVFIKKKSNFEQYLYLFRLQGQILVEKFDCIQEFCVELYSKFLQLFFYELNLLHGSSKLLCKLERLYFKVFLVNMQTQNIFMNFNCLCTCMMLHKINELRMHVIPSVKKEIKYCKFAGFFYVCIINYYLPAWLQ